METILVIEDDENIRQNIVEILELEEYSVLCEEDGQAGLAAALEKSPDLILCDIMLPGLDGYEILSRIRKSESLGLTPFIFLTAKTTKEDLRKGMTGGADDYLTKPFTIDELLQAVKSRLQKHHLLSEKINHITAELSHMIPHEFKTPLNAIIGFSDLLMQTDTLGNINEVKDMASQINASGYRLLHLIENYLLHTELMLLKHNPCKSKKQEEKKIINTGEVITYEAKKAARRYNREADLFLDLKEQYVFALYKELKKIISELLDNAFKFSLPSSPVTIRTAKEKGRFLLTISDEGRGIKNDQIKEIDSFRQFDRDYYEQSGLGLGLILVTNLLSLLKGTFDIQSMYGKGTTVTISLDASDKHF